MQVSDTNNVKIYNLSAGRSLPEWLSNRKRRALIKKNLDYRRRIELIQDFDMPGISNTIKLSKDGQYIMATGIYKPRIKCFEVNNFSLKYERCFDAEAVTFEMLSDDYSKFVLLQCDRYVEFHVAHGRHHRLRIPKFGRDMKYHFPTCDLLLVGASSDVYRINLERGMFMTPMTSNASAMNRIAINPLHYMIACGTQEGKIEAWDPRTKGQIGTLDCAMSCLAENQHIEGFPSVTSLCFNGGLQMAVGTATGQILLYDIRANKPYFMKDHMYGFPIIDVDFHQQQNLVYSIDKTVLKIWDKNNGKIYTTIETEKDFNNLCVVPNSGLMFMANEGKKMQIHYIPSLGPAPRWASFLDSLTEELEESNAEIVYDDYKFVTKQELTNLGLDHLIGTEMLRAYMHGYFIDIRLYKKAKAVSAPFEIDEFRKKKIRETIEKDRTNRVQVNKIPKVNKELALKLMNDQMEGKKKLKTGSLLDDVRFKAMFENPSFEVDKTAAEYRLLAPVLSRLDKNKQKEVEKKIVGQEFAAVEEELEGKNSSDESSDEDEYYNKDKDKDDKQSESSGWSSDDDQQWTKDLKKQHKIIARERRMEEYREEQESKQPKMFELRQGEEFKGVNVNPRRANHASLAERLETENVDVKLLGSVGNREMTFSTVKQSKRDRYMDRMNERHREERKKVIRPTTGIKTRSFNSYFNKRGGKRR